MAAAEYVMECCKADINHEWQVAFSINLTYNAFSNRLPDVSGHSSENSL